MQTFGANTRGNTTIYVAMCLLVSAANSMFNPVLSLFFNTELNFSPLQISIFFMLLPIATILIVQTVARFSDIGLQRPAIICIASLFGVASSYMLYMRPSFIVLCTIGLLLLGSYTVSFPQIYASAREYAVKYLGGSLMFATFMRSLASVSWVVGPPVAYGIAMGYSFNTLFLVTAISFALICVTSFFFLPSVLDKAAVDKSRHIKWWTNRSVLVLTLFLVTAISFALICVTSFFFLPSVLDKAAVDKSRHIKWWTNRSVLVLFASIGLMFTAFSSYINTMPLYFTQELKLDKDLPGYMLGLAAFIEIPLMFLAARITKTFGIKYVILVGGIALVIFLVLLLRPGDTNYYLLITFFAALYIAFVATMGMVFFQELLPAIPGQATSLYINASVSGQIAGGGLISLAESGSYTIVYMVGAAVCTVGILLLFFVKKPDSVSYS